MPLSHRALRLLPLLVAHAHASVRLKCNTTVDVNDGILEIDLWPGTASQGVKRIIDMAEDGFFSGLPFYQVLHNMVTFGLQPDSEKQLAWNSKGDIPDDPMPRVNPEEEGLLCFSGDPGKRDHSRSTLLFFTLGHKRLMANRKTPWEVPVGKLIKGLDVVKGIYSGERQSSIRSMSIWLPTFACPSLCCHAASHSTLCLRLTYGSVCLARTCAAGYGDEPQFALLNPTSTAKKLDPNDPAHEMSRRWAAAAAKSADDHWAKFPKLDRIHSCSIVRDKHSSTDPNPSSSKDEL